MKTVYKPAIGRLVPVFGDLEGGECFVVRVLPGIVFLKMPEMMSCVSLSTGEPWEFVLNEGIIRVCPKLVNFEGAVVFEPVDG